MKYLPLIWAGLWRKRARSILTLLSVTTAFVLFGILQGVTAGFAHTIDRFMDGARLRIQNRTNITAALPEAYMSQIEAVDGVRSVASFNFFGGYYGEPENGVGGAAIDVDRWSAVVPEYVMDEATMNAMRRTRTGAVVGSELLEEYGWKVGDRITLTSPWTKTDGSNEWAFDIVGTYTLREGSFPENDALWINYAYFDEARSFGNGTVTMYMLKVEDERRSPEIAAEIDAMFRNSQNQTLTQSDRDYIRAQIDRIGDINFIVNSIVGAVLFTLMFLTGNTMMQSIRERIPELAVLKTYGFGNAAITALVVGESLVLCLFAAAVGLGIAAAAFPYAYDAMGVAPLPLEPRVLVIGAGAAALLALVSALPPVLRAHRLNVVDALAGR